MALTTTIEEVAGRVPITVLALDGELDASNFERLIVEVSGLYDRGTRNLLVDLSGLTFLASSGLVAFHSIVRILHGERPDDLESGWDVFCTTWATTRRPGTRCSAKSSSRPLRQRSPASSSERGWIACSSSTRAATPPSRRSEAGPLSGDRRSPPVRAGEVVAGEVVGGDALTPERLGPILDPFAAPDSGIAILVEDMDGRLIATAGAVPDDAPVTSVQEIRCGPGKAAIGRVVGRGDGPIVEAVVASLTNALAALAGTTHEHVAGGAAAHRLEAEMALSRRSSAASSR